MVICYTYVVEKVGIKKNPSFYHLFYLLKYETFLGKFQTLCHS